MTGRPLLSFDLDGVLCRPPFGINPGRNIGKPRTAAGHAGLLWRTERWRYLGRRPMPGAREGFARLSERYDCVVVSARSEVARGATEAWFQRWFGMVPPIHLRPGPGETSAAFKVRKLPELRALAHFEDDPHTAAWLAESLPAVFLIDWWRNRWLHTERVHRVQRIAEAEAVLATLELSPAHSPRD